MDRNSKFAVPVSPESRAHYIGRITEHEIFVAKVKLAGLLLLGVVDLIVIACVRIPP